MGESRVRESVSGLTGDGRGRLLASVAFGWFLLLGMRFVVPSILPTITAGFDATDSQAGLAITVLWLTYGLMQFPAGYYADRLSERVLLVVSLLISAVGLVTYTFTPTFSLFVVVTGVFGLGSGLYGPPRGTVVSKTYDENDGAAFGAMLAAGSIGASLLPAVAAILVAAVGWRATLSWVAPALLVAAIGIWRAVPDTRIDSAQNDSLGNALRGAVAAVQDVRIALAVLGAGLMLFVFQAVTAFLTTYLVDVKGVSQATAGTVLGVLFVVGAVSQWFGGGLADRFGASRVLTAISLVSVVPLLALPLADGRFVVAALAALIGLRMSIGPVSNAYIVGLLPDAVQGTAWGAIRTGLFVLGSFGSTLVGFMADAGSFDLAFYVLAGLTGVGALVYHFLPER